jgi:hypothetical protein
VAPVVSAAVMVILLVRAAAGSRPEISPVAALMLNPAGSPVAEKVSFCPAAEA